MMVFIEYADKLQYEGYNKFEASILGTLSTKPTNEDKLCQKQILELTQFCKDTCQSPYEFNIYDDALKYSMRVRLSSERDLFMFKLKYGERCTEPFARSVI